MNRIRSVALTGAVAGTIGAVLYSYEVGAPFTIGLLPEFATEHWRALAGAWLSFYGISVMLLDSAATLGRARKTPYLAPKQWGLDFLCRLVTNQYFSCLVLLFVLGSAGLLLQQTDSYPITLPFAPFLVVVALGLLAWSMCSAIVLFGLLTAEPSTTLTAHERPGPGLPMYSPYVERELQNLASLIQQQRPLIEAARDTAAAFYELGQTIHADIGILSERQQGLSSEGNTERSAADLQTAVGLLEEGPP